MFQPICKYRVKLDNRIRSVEGDWQAFACENGP